MKNNNKKISSELSYKEATGRVQARVGGDGDLWLGVTGVPPDWGSQAREGVTGVPPAWGSQAREGGTGDPPVSGLQARAEGTADLPVSGLQSWEGCLRQSALVLEPGILPDAAGAAPVADLAAEQFSQEQLNACADAAQSSAAEPGEGIASNLVVQNPCSRTTLMESGRSLF